MVVRATVAAALSTVLAVLPPFLVGALSVPMRRELGFTEVDLGVAVSAFFAASAIASVGGGWIAQRRGAATAIAAGVAGSSAAMGAIGLVTTRFAHVVACLCLAGVASAVAQPGASLLLTQVVPGHRQGLAFGVTQGSVPLSTLLAGAAVPGIALPLGWRWAFAGALTVGAAVLAAWPWGSAPPRERAAPLGVGDRRPRATADLLVLAFVAVLGAGAGNALGTFYVESAVASGLGPGAAGWWLSAGSLCGVLARVLWGWQADRRGGRPLGRVALLMAVGAAGPAALALPGHRFLPLATAVAFAAGWGWNGLFTLAVVRAHPRSPALAVGVTTTGIFLGGAGGPLVFGLLVQRRGYGLAWLAMAGALLVAAVLALLADGADLPPGRGRRDRPAGSGTSRLP